MIRSIFIAILAFLVFVPVAQSDENTNHRELLSKHYRLEKPDGEGPFPAVMLVPACSSFNNSKAPNFYKNVQNKLVELGFVTLRVDYIAARNIESCMGTNTTSAGNDICIAADYLNQQTFVKKGAVNVIGWSFGGAAVFRALRSTGSKKAAQVDAAVTYHPYCNAARRWKSDVPVLVLMGTKDNITPVTACEYLFSTLPKRDRLTIRIYEDAHHLFDMDELPPETTSSVVTGSIGYNKAAAEAAWIEVTKFLKR